MYNIHTDRIFLPLRFKASCINYIYSVIALGFFC